MGQDWYWDAFKRKYVTKEEEMAEKSAGKQLTDVGTRYRHLTDLRGIWQDGLEALNRINKAYQTKQDLELITALEHAVFHLDKQVLLMGKYDLKRFALAREIDSIPRRPEGYVDEPADSNSPDQKV